MQGDFSCQQKFCINIRLSHSPERDCINLSYLPSWPEVNAVKPDCITQDLIPTARLWEEPGSATKSEVVA